MDTPKNIRERLLAEYRRRKAGDGWTMDDLLDHSGLSIGRSALHKKLHGSLGMTFDEAKAIGAALGVRVEVTVRRVRGAAA